MNSNWFFCISNFFDFLNQKLNFIFKLNNFLYLFSKTRNREFDLDGEIENINFNINNGVIPIKKGLEEFNENSKTVINFFSQKSH